MSQNQRERLIHMVNQIADNHRAYVEADAVARVADHLKRFWARSMKEQLMAYYRSDGQQLNPIARQAVESLMTLPPGG